MTLAFLCTRSSQTFQTCLTAHILLHRMGPLFRRLLSLTGKGPISAEAEIRKRKSGRANIEKFKEVIYPQVPLRIPCYDLAPLMTN